MWYKGALARRPVAKAVRSQPATKASIVEPVVGDASRCTMLSQSNNPILQTIKPMPTTLLAPHNSRPLPGTGYPKSMSLLQSAIGNATGVLVPR